MQSLLTDIELDIQELKDLVQLASVNPDQRLYQVMGRRASQLEERCRKLKELLENEIVRQQVSLVLEEIPVELKSILQEEVLPLEECTVENVDISPVQDKLPEEPEPVAEEVMVSGTETFSISDIKPILGESIRKRTGLVGSLSLNDCFRYSQELFNGDITWMNETLKRIEQEANSPEDAFRIIEEVASDKEATETIADFREWIMDYFDR